MTFLTARIERAAGDAPLFDTFNTKPLSSINYADEPDDFPLHLNPNGVSEVNHVYTDAKRGDLCEFLQAVDKAVTSPCGDWYIDYCVRHETQHWQAAQMLGATSGLFGAAFFRFKEAHEDEPQLYYYPFFAVLNMRTTKLGAALIAGYPLQPSQGDMSDVKSYGYKSVREIADKAWARNISRKQTDPMFPTPLSVSPGGLGLDCKGMWAY